MGILKFNAEKEYEIKDTVFYDGFGTKIKGSNLRLIDVLDQSGLNYVVKKDKSYDADGNEIGYYHTYYDEGNEENSVRHFLGGGLSAQYTIVQNHEAFDWLDALLGKDLKVECAGAVNDGKQVYICASTEPIKVLDEDIAPHLVFSNSHDGGGSVKVMLTPIRVFCSNCMTRATQRAQSIFYIKHTKSAHSNLYIAQDVLLKNTKYLEVYKEGIEDMAKVQFTRRQFVDKLVPFVLTQMGLLDADGKPIEKKRNANIVDVYRDHLLACWSTEDTKNQSHTLVNAYNALTNFESHLVPQRNAGKPETTFKRIIAGMTLSNIALEYAANMVGHSLKF